MGRSLTGGSDGANNTPLGAFADVFTTGVNFKPTGAVLLRSAYPELSDAFPSTGLGVYSAGLQSGYLSPEVFTSVCHGQGKFVAVGNGIIYVSLDGIVWNKQTAPTGNYQTVFYANGLFVAMGATSDCATSPDAVVWTVRGIPSTAGGSYATWRSVAYGNGVFVAVAGGYNASVDSIAATSPDGFNWTQRTIAGGTTNWSRVAFGNGLFVAVSTTGRTDCATSPDGITWTRRTLPQAANWDNLIYANGLFVAIAGGSGAATTIAATSPDGITWTARTLPLAYNWSGLAYGNGYFYAISNSGGGANTIAVTSTDGFNWMQRSIPSGIWVSLAFGDGLFVGVCGNGTATGNTLRTYIEGANSTYIWLPGTAGKFVRVS